MIAWGALGVEFIVSLIAAGGVVSIFALGLRMPAVGAPLEARAAGDVERVADGELPLSHQRPTWASLAAYLCFAIAIAAVLYGIYLIIPQFHQ
ncbi:hypothetical protein GCM10022286_14100 [Gryllotalpicola daejeonensis]|uniref:Peptidase n=1 Tax=Gryllotalpicola daejeonensis TaxID=993087 RepID=A0ABP7ZJ08_9MICO